MARGDEGATLLPERGRVYAADAGAAELISISDADEFFHTIQQHVESLRDFARPHPLSTEAAVASLKRYLAEPRHRIRLADLVDDVVDLKVGVTFELTADGPAAEALLADLRQILDDLQLTERVRIDVE